jgi:hypothetical protein
MRRIYVEYGVYNPNNLLKGVLRDSMALGISRWSWVPVHIPAEENVGPGRVVLNDLDQVDPVESDLGAVLVHQVSIAASPVVVSSERHLRRSGLGTLLGHICSPLVAMGLTV